MSTIMLYRKAAWWKRRGNDAWRPGAPSAALAVTLLLITSIFFAGCEPTRRVTGRSPESTYRTYCADCHGADGENDRAGAAPRMLVRGSGLTSEQIAAIVANGRGGMPAFANRLTDEERTGIAQLAARWAKRR